VRYVERIVTLQQQERQEEQEEWTGARDVAASPAHGGINRSGPWRTLLLVALLTGLIYGAVVAITISHYSDNVSALIVAGEQFVERYPGSPGHHTVVYRHDSYDGLGYYYIAGNPFMRDPYIHDALRYQRIGYPFLVWAVSLGQRAWQPGAMIGVNIVAVMAVALLAGALIMWYAPGASVWWALACAVNPALIIGVRDDLIEPLLTALALAGLLLYLRGRVGWAALVFAAALLTREVGILFLAPLLVAELTARRWPRFVVLALSVVPYLIWQQIVTRAIGYSSTDTVEHNFQPLLVGMRLVVAGLPYVPAWERMYVPGIVAAMVIVVAALAVAAWQAWRRYDVVLGGIIVHCIAALFGGWVIWQGYRSAPRVFGGLYPLLIFAYLLYRRRNPGFAPVVGLILLLTIFVFVTQVVVAPTQAYYVTP